jgi:tetratricopeptide (TPR) repeat protein
MSAVWLLPLVLAAQNPAPAAGEAAAIERLYSEWRFAEADRALDALLKARPAEPATLVAQGYARFLAGDYRAAVASYEAAAAQVAVGSGLRELLSLAKASAEAVDGHREQRSANFVFRCAAEDAVLADYGLETLEAARAALASDLGFATTRPITVDVVRGSRELAAMTTLGEDEIERTGTVAVSKWSRIMLTSPRAMHLGYEWRDSLAHELVHYAIAASTYDRAPVWLQEGLAKFLELRWRAPAGLDLHPSLKHYLAKALGSGRLISFEAMHPSMAKLPRAEDAALAFAEVTTAVACLFDRGGAAALRAVLATVRDGGDARVAVARAYGGSGAWSDFERAWQKYMTGQRYRTLPGLESMAPKYKKKAAGAPSEDDASSGLGEAGRFLRLGNMLLLRNRLKPASVEYEKGQKLAGSSQWIFAVKLGRTYLALGQSVEASRVIAAAVQTYPELPWPHLIAGQAALAQGDAAAAAAALLRSLAINPYDPSVHCSLAEAYRRLPDTPAEKRQRAERDCQQLGR